MKITAYDPEYSVWVAQGTTMLDASTGSNAGYGPDVDGEPGDLSVVALRQVVSLSSNMGDNTLGSVLTTVQSSPWVAQFAVASNAGAPSSLGSNVAITAVFDGGGAAVSTTTAVVDLEIPFSATIQRATLLLDQTSSTVVAVWRDAYGNYPPTIADAITGASPPTTSAAAKSQDATLSGWSTSISPGDTLRFAVASNSAATRITCSLVAVRGLP